MSEPVNRREFIKGAGVVTGGILLATHAPDVFAMAASTADDEGEKGERGFWERSRFFEDISHFDAQMEQQVRESLDEFAQNYGPLINSNDTGIGFNVDVWKDVTGSTVDMLGRIKRVRDTLKAKSPLDSDASRMLQQDYYDAASLIWGLLRVGEKFKKDPEAFATALTERHVSKDTGFSDPFLGEEIFGIKSQWALSDDVWDKSRLSSRFRSLLNTAGSDELKVWTANAWWQRQKGPAGLRVYKKDPNLSGRPAPFSIEVAEDPSMVGEISQILENDRMNRVGINFSAVNTQEENSHGSYYHDENTDGTSRNIVLEMADGLTKDQMKKYPYLTHAITIHEGAHALWELIPFIKDDVQMFKHRVFVDRMLRLFRPYPSYARYMAPKGEFYKNINLNADGSFGDANWNERYRVINNSTVTEYAARKYAEIDLWPISNFFEKGWQLGKRMPVNRPGPYVASPLTSVIEVACANSPGLEYKPESFSEFWQAFSEVVQNDPNITMSDFERLIFAEVGKNATLFDSPERSDYVFRENWGQYLAKVVLPLAAIQVYKNDPQFFVDKYVEHVGNPGIKKSVEQAFDVIFNAVEGERPWRGRQPDTDEDGNKIYGYEWRFNRGYNKSDLEQFAEIVAYNHVRKMPGTVNEVPDTWWEAADHVINALIDDLIADELAVAPSPALVF